jgi:hypothetical protein
MSHESTPATTARALAVATAVRACRVALALLAPALASAPAFAQATIDLTNGVLTYTSPSGVANDLTVSLADGVYTLDDPPQSSFLLLNGVLAAGCLTLDANTLTCLEPAIESFVVNLGDLDDQADLATALDPARIVGGTGDDTLVGGKSGDTFDWYPGHGSDLVDGGGSQDALLFSASNGDEIMTITAAAAGFVLTRNIGAVTLDVASVEVLQLLALGGVDTLTVEPLGRTTLLRDGGDLTSDQLDVDGGEACLAGSTGAVTGTGVAPIVHRGFETVFVTADCLALFADGVESGDAGSWSAAN